MEVLIFTVIGVIFITILVKPDSVHTGMTRVKSMMKNYNNKKRESKENKRKKSREY
jgi:uncharacterized membrane protein (DUF106 family)